LLPNGPQVFEAARARNTPGGEENLRRGFFISRADVAHLMLRVITQPDTIKQTIGIAC
jgi:hypothetical protein